MGAPIDLTGCRFGRALVISETSPHITAGGSKQRQWLCRCDCGNRFITSTQNLRSGDTQSCGCYKVDMNRINATSHGESKTKLYSIWKAMKKRCNNHHNTDYRYYGEKGVSVCAEWADDFVAFRDWAMKNGFIPNLTIDRIDNSKGYSPDNCRWVCMKSQCNHRTNSRVYSIGNETHTVAEWAEKYGINYTTLYMRLRNGMTIQEAIQYNSNK